MISGRCLCARIQYEIEGKISPIWLCHCSKCRRTSGSAFHAGAICSANKFRWRTGGESITEYEDTPRYVTAFCSQCGAPVPRPISGTDLVFLHVGGLDGDPERSVDHHIFCASKAPWFKITDSQPQFAEHKPGST